MPFYEHVFIARQDISSQQVDELTASFARLIAENGGTLVKSEYWGLRNLAYRIRKNRKGHYVLFNIDAPWPAVAELERNEKLNEDIIRTMTIRLEAIEDGPSIMMQVKAAREERARRDGESRPRRSEEDREETGDEA